MIRWLVFIHILSALTFFLAYGTSAAMAFQIRKETNFERIKAMLDLSNTTIMFLFIAFLVMGISGLILPFLFQVWNTGWVWTSIVLMLVVFFWMVFMNERNYKKLRRLVGLPYMVGGKEFPAEPPASQEEIQVHIRSINVTQLVIVGYVIPAFVAWLMTFKPF
jgi:membrane protein implicated in regulation of membrane protease activity